VRVVNSIACQGGSRREKHELAIQLYRKALPILDKGFGPSHPDVVSCKTGLRDSERHHGQ
jgi:hypothetical protein